jgi:hypothetical protein
VLQEQLSTRPWIAAKLTDDVWTDIAGPLNAPIDGTVSVAKNQPYFAAGAQIAAFIALTCSYLIGHHRKLADRVFQKVSWSGLA